MKLPRLLLTAAPLALGTWLVEPTTSYACGADQCANDQFLPRSGAVPANIEAIAWQPGFDARDGADASLKLPSFECTAADGGKHTVSFLAQPEDKPDHLQLQEALKAGEHCTIRSGISDCSIDDPGFDVSYLNGQADFDVVDASPVPEQLGLIAVTAADLGTVDVAANASCSENLEVCIVSSSLDLNIAATPWKDALLYETIVDGERFSTGRSLALPSELGGLYSGRDGDVVFAPLGSIPDNVSLARQLDLGEHSFQIRAHLPGSSQTLATPVVTIVLSCGGTPMTLLAQNMIAGDSDGCSVADVGSARRHAGVLFAMFGVLLMAARRRRVRR